MRANKFKIELPKCDNGVQSRIATDKIDEKMSKETLRTEVSGIDRKWLMKREVTFPKYTT